MEKLSQTLMQKNPNLEQTKSKASNNSHHLHRKQSVPDLNDYNYADRMPTQNRVTFSSSNNLSQPNQQPFQVVQIQTNSTQQPIYASRTQLNKEIQDMYGTIDSRPIYANDPQNAPDAPYHYNGFYNKVLV